jgi:hypothetical protein
MSPLRLFVVHHDCNPPTQRKQNIWYGGRASNLRLRVQDDSTAAHGTCQHCPELEPTGTGVDHPASCLLGHARALVSTVRRMVPFQNRVRLDASTRSEASGLTPQNTVSSPGPALTCLGSGGRYLHPLSSANRDGLVSSRLAGSHAPRTTPKSSRPAALRSVIARLPYSAG